MNVLMTLIMHTEARWLSKGNCLERLLALFDIVIDFFLNDDDLVTHILERKTCIGYLSDFYGKFNTLKKILQAKILNLI